MPSQVQHQPPEQSPNLIRPEAYYGSSSSARTVKAIIQTNKTLLFLVEFVLLTLIVYNGLLSKQLEGLDSELAASEGKLNSYANVEKEIIALKRQLLSLETLIARHPKIQDEISVVYAATPLEIKVEQMEYDKEILYLKLDTPRSEYFAKMIQSYLSHPRVMELVLTEAAYSPSRGSYGFTVEVFFKSI